MDLIDRYLIAVRRNLPPPMQKDIVAELADSLRSEAEAREQQAGRPLTAEDQAELLRKHGHPWLMASRYLPQQQLVGPALYPYYRRAVSVVVFWVVLPITLIGGVLAALYNPDSARVWSRAIGAAWTGSIYAVGIITLVFAVLEHHHVRITAFDNWQPANLPEPSHGREVPRSESVIGLVVTATMLLWWAGWLNVPVSMTFVDGPASLTAEPVWARLYLPVLAVLALGVVASAVDIIKPWRTTFMSILHIGLTLANVAIIGALLDAGRWVTVSGPAGDDRIARAEYWINQTIEWTLVIVALFMVLDVVLEIRRAIRARREALA
jgi:hypothetical protein